MIARLPAALLTPVRRLSGAWRASRRTVASLPEAVEAILILPRLSEQLKVIGLQTATLIEMQEEIARMRSHTSELPPINARLEQVATLLERVDANTAAVEQLAEVMVPLQGAASRVGAMADRWPSRRGSRASAPLPDER